MSFWIPVWAFWIVGGAICLIAAGVMYKRGSGESAYFGLFLDPFAMVWVGAFGVLGLIGIGKGLVTLLR